MEPSERLRRGWERLFDVDLAETAVHSSSAAHQDVAPTDHSAPERFDGFDSGCPPGGIETGEEAGCRADEGSR